MLARRLLLAAGLGGAFAGGGDMTFHGVRAKYYTGAVPLNQAVPNATFTAVKFNYTGPNQRCFDTDSFHPINTESNLSGTVTKTAGSAVVTGSGTSFTAQLAVGYPVKIPGGETYYPDVMVVASIQSDTQFTAYSTAQYSASGATATLDSSVFVIPPGMAGYYFVSSNLSYRGNTTGIREINISYNGLEKGVDGRGSNNSVDAEAFVSATPSGEWQLTASDGPVHLAEGNFVQVFTYQDSGGSLNLACDLPGLPFGMWLVGT